MCEHLYTLTVCNLYFSPMVELSCKISFCVDGFWMVLLPWRCPLMMKASQEDAAGCTQGCPRQAMLCCSWTMSRTQCWSLDACSRLK